jgi:hypothetical protein
MDTVSDDDNASEERAFSTSGSTAGLRQPHFAFCLSLLTPSVCARTAAAALSRVSQRCDGFPQFASPNVRNEGKPSSCCEAHERCGVCRGSIAVWE